MTINCDDGVSICIAVYQAERFIRQTLDSVIAQNFINFECIVSVDSCSDNSLKICRKYAQEDQRFKIFAQSERQGWVNNVNFCFSQISCRYCMILSHDDTLDPNYISTLLPQLKQNSQAIVAFSGMQHVYPNGSMAIQHYLNLNDKDSILARAYLVLDRTGPWWIAYRGIFPSWVIRQYGGLEKNAAGEFSADFNWVLRLALLGQFIASDKVLYFKERRPESLSAQWRHNIWQYTALYLSCIKTIIRLDLPKAVTLALVFRIIRKLGGRIKLALLRPFK